MLDLSMITEKCKVIFSLRGNFTIILVYFLHSLGVTSIYIILGNLLYELFSKTSLSI